MSPRTSGSRRRNVRRAADPGAAALLPGACTDRTRQRTKRRGPRRIGTDGRLLANAAGEEAGIRTGSRVVLLGAPEGFSSALEPLPEGVSLGSELPGVGEVDVVVWFCRSRGGAGRRPRGRGPEAGARRGVVGGVAEEGFGVATDLEFSGVQAAGLGLGLVDNKVCAVDEVFSGLRFVVRREDREAWTAGRRP